MAWLIRKNIQGKKFSKLYVLSPAQKPATWVCLCDCGKLCEKSQTNLRRGDAKSCGCLRLEYNQNRRRFHGKPFGRHSHKTEYTIWACAKSRCINPKDTNYKNYGARGIKMCPAWSESFEQFIKDMGRRPQGLTLDRIDFNKGYSKENCRWATQKEQQNNKRTNTIMTYKGKRLNLKQWSELTGIRYDTVVNRYTKGLEPEKVLATKTLKHFKLEWAV